MRAWCEAQASLLKRLRPTDFQSFAAFVAWRADIVQLLLSVLGLAARHVSRRNSRLATSCRTLMARLKVTRLLSSLTPSRCLSLILQNATIVIMVFNTIYRL